MDLSRRACDYWGLDLSKEPFGNTIKGLDGVFSWPAFDEIVERVVFGITRRHFTCLAGSACSAKSTIWSAAQRRMSEEQSAWVCCQPRSIEISALNEGCLLRMVKETVEPDDGTRKTAFKRDREARARQVRQLLENENASGHPVVIAINDAHEATVGFLYLLKRIWDDLHGFDRLLGVMLIGQAGLAKTVTRIPEIAERATILHAPGLGDHIENYVGHELARCGGDLSQVDPDGFDELAKLQGPIDKAGNPNWLTRRDHPLIVNNVLSTAFSEGHRIKAKTVGRDLIADAMQRSAS
jgi:type II secretory pathway predicted ATPase ExeA